MDIQKLIEMAHKASLNSYSPYSNFPVGASLLTKSGQYYQGCNIENASYGLSNCAERTCLFTAYADGVKKEDIVAFCVYSPKEHLISPCGACRQVLAELIPAHCPIYMAYGKEGKYQQTTIEELLPCSFNEEDLKND